MAEQPAGDDLAHGVTTRKCGACGGLYSPSDESGRHAGCSLAPPDSAGHTAIVDSDRTLKAPSDVARPSSDIARGSGSSGAPGSGNRRRAEAELPAEVKEAAREPKNLLNQYILVKQIGKGGMGTVWRAFDRRLLRWAAIKFLIVEDEEGVLRFEREAQLAARLRHPNIAPIYEVMREGVPQPFIAMEFIDGVSLEKLQVPLRELLDLFAKVCDGVEAAHKAGVVHRDLKPQNVMVTKEKWPYVMDFGLAKALETESSLSVSGAIMGTPAYMPPEQAQGKLDQIDSRSDVYSLGATLYALVTRKQPFSGQTPMDTLMKVCKEDPIPPRKHAADIPVEVETIILKAMGKEKTDRYPSAAAMAADIRSWLGGGDIEARGPSSMHLLVRKLKRNLWPVLAAAALLAAVGAVAFGVMRPRPPAEESGAVGPDDRPVAASPIERGTFRLKLAVAPYAEITRITCDGKPVEVPQRFTPVVISDLAIGSYELELTHPTLGKRKVAIAPESGLLFQVHGHMRDPELKVSRGR